MSEVPLYTLLPVTSTAFTFALPLHSFLAPHPYPLTSHRSLPHTHLSSLIGCTSCIVKSRRSRSSFISSPLWTPSFCVPTSYVRYRFSLLAPFPLSRLSNSIWKTLHTLHEQGYLAHKKPPTLGPCSGPMPRALWWSYGGGVFL